MERKGLVHIYTGDGKGKTTASVGLAVRAAGQGLKVLFVQFFKEDSASSGEKEILRKLGVELVRSNCRHPIFTKNTDEGKVKRAIEDTYRLAKEESSAFDLLVLDEVMSCVNGGWIDMEDLISFLKERPAGLEVVLTGRDAPVELQQVSDYVTEMLKIKHPFDTGVKARKGIEY
ncbi:MAG: cob(I)yrinic acid a,c-diamide adenosyltransferase [Deltaproteobacteria bacterium]|nr:cob(I)yrinic acid a,c-diamide adenosyltransferase [Deltaproteobacteria bacterium]